MAGGVLLNIACLGMLKYYNFFISSLNQVFKTDYNLIRVFLPLGLSFFTFQFIALIYDCYKGKIEELSFVKYVLFASFFPKIIQGPIMVYQDFDRQYSLDEKNYFNAENVAKGIYAFTLGLGKKILIADLLADFVNAGFSQEYQSYNSTMLLLLVLAYTLQIYFDFSGYSDMARGLGLLFNIELPINFNSPYKALSVNDFWKRWHMTLTSFFTKYLYIPLGGNRKGEWKTYRNVLIVYLVSGLWHGANYTFIIWGLLHGVVSVVEKKWKFTEHMHIAIRWLYTFVFVNFAWLFFRANSVEQACFILKGIFRCDFSGVSYASFAGLIPQEINILANVLGVGGIVTKFFLLFMILLVFAVLWLKNTDEKIATFKPNLKTLLILVFVFCWSVLSFGGKIVFLYEMF